MNSLHALPRPAASRALLNPAHGAPAHASLAGILRERLLRPRFQPVVDLSHSRIYGHESLIRGPADTPLHFPDALFAEARRQGLHPQLELASFRAGARGFEQNDAAGKLFLNLSGSALLHYWTLWGHDMPARLLKDALPEDARAQLSPERLATQIQAYYLARGWTPEGWLPNEHRSARPVW